MVMRLRSGSMVLCPVCWSTQTIWHRPHRPRLCTTITVTSNQAT